jgi:hypothetical protein
MKRRDKRRPLAGLALEIRVSPIKEQLTNRVSRCIFNRRTFFYAPSIIPIRLSNRAAASRTPKHIGRRWEHYHHVCRSLCIKNPTTSF